MSVGLIVPLVMALISAYLIMTGLSSGESTAGLEPGMNPKLLLLLGGVFGVGSVIIAAEILMRGKRQARRHEAHDSPGA